MAIKPPPMKKTKGIFPLGEAAEWTAARYGDKTAFRIWRKDHYDELTYRQFREQVDAIAQWLMAWGLKPGDRVAILSENRPEWAVTYFAIHRAGGVAVPVDRLLQVSGVRHILSDSASRLLFAGEKYIHSMEESAPISTLEGMVCFDGDVSEESLDMADIIREGEGANLPYPKRGLDELAQIMYTSGTTGVSKGVMHSSRNIVLDASLAARAVEMDENDNFLSVLPIHHAYECSLGLLCGLYMGVTITYARSLKSHDLLKDIKASNTTVIVGVPLLFEKIHQGIMRGLKKKSWVVRALYHLLMFLSRMSDKMFHKFIGGSIFKSFRDKTGFGTLRILICGGGPLNPKTFKFFNRFGILMLQGYGLTETSPNTHYTFKEYIRYDSVGVPYPGVECKLKDVDDNGVGEVCIRGDIVFIGYYKNEEATKAAFDDDGWFMTGDLGRLWGGEFLTITGRKKNVIVTGGGKNVYPEEIEHDLIESDFIQEVLVLGVKRSSGYGEEVAALVYPNYEEMDVFFEKGGRSEADKDLYSKVKKEIQKVTKPSTVKAAKSKRATEEDVHTLIKHEIKRLQKESPDFKRIRHFRIVDEEFQKTSTRKVKRFLYSGDMVKMSSGKM